MHHLWDVFTAPSWIWWETADHCSNDFLCPDRPAVRYSLLLQLITLQSRGLLLLLLGWILESQDWSATLRRPVTLSPVCAWPRQASPWITAYHTELEQRRNSGYWTALGQRLWTQRDAKPLGIIACPKKHLCCDLKIFHSVNHSCGGAWRAPKTIFRIIDQ